MSYSEWGSFTLLGYFRLPQIMAFMAQLQCALSHYSELNVVRFIWAKFSWVLKTHFPSRWNAFSCSSVDRVFLSVWNSSIAPTECQKSYCFGKEIMKAVWKSFSLYSYRTVLSFHHIHLLHLVLAVWYAVVYYMKGPTIANTLSPPPFKDTVFTESSQ